MSGIISAFSSLTPGVKLIFIGIIIAIIFVGRGGGKGGSSGGSSVGSTPPPAS